MKGVEGITGKFLVTLALGSLLLCRCDNNENAPSKEPTHVEKPPILPKKTLYKEEIKIDKDKEVSQQELFDMVRNGVVSVKATALALLDPDNFWRKSWLGTGFLVDLSKGLIVTNAHVAGEKKAACSFDVTFGNGVHADAKLEYIDPCYDIAVLSVDPKRIPVQCIALRMSDSLPQVNASVFAMGSTAGNEFSSYQGVIFDTCSIIKLQNFPEQAFQFSGLTAGGASGSPVFLKNGEVIGLLFGGKLVSGAALPINCVKPIIESITKGEKLTKFFCGFMLKHITTQDAVEGGFIPEDVANEYNEKFPEANSKILCVSKGSAGFEDKSEKEGVKPGDVIVSVEGKEIGPHLLRFDEAIQKSKGERIKATVYRNGKLLSVYIYAKPLQRFDNIRFLTFGSSSFYETQDDTTLLKGVKKRKVFCSIGEESPLRSLEEPGETCYPQMPRVIVQVEGTEITTLDDLFAIMPAILKKKIFRVASATLGADGKESIALVHHEPEVAEATLFTFDPVTRSWKTKGLRNGDTSTP